MEIKDAFWFKHDSNAKDDPKITLLIDQLGIQGYGIYWVLIETLRDQPTYSYPLNLISSIARKYNAEADVVKAVIDNYGLFETDDISFYSPSLIRRMEAYNQIKESRRLAGIASGESRRNKAQTKDKQELNTCSTSDKHELNEEKRIEENREEKKIEDSKREDTDIHKQIISSLNQISGRNFRLTESTKKFINGRLKEGFTLADFESVIKHKVKEWSNTEMAQYIRPKTLFGTKFESYLESIPKPKPVVEPKDKPATDADRELISNILAKVGDKVWKNWELGKN
jgi:uncharacterized phage protein (TIGR02220 family)